MYKKFNYESKTVSLLSFRNGDYVCGQMKYLILMSTQNMSGSNSKSIIPIKIIVT